MNGAESLARTLVAGGVDVCFTNPGTSEMHFVAALDRVEGIRCVLGLFEGVVTGAADGHWRMADRPAATLPHLGPGLVNGLANLHNPRKASPGTANAVGEHAAHPVKHDPPGPPPSWPRAPRPARSRPSSSPPTPRGARPTASPRSRRRRRAPRPTAPRSTAAPRPSARASPRC